MVSYLLMKKDYANVNNYPKISLIYSDIIALSSLKKTYLNNLMGKEYSKHILLG